MTIEITKEQAAELLEDIYTAYDEGKCQTSNEVIRQLLKISPPEYEGIWARLMQSVDYHKEFAAKHPELVTLPPSSTVPENAPPTCSTAQPGT